MRSSMPPPRRRRRRQPVALRLTCLATAAALPVAACSGGDGQATTTTSTITPSTTTLAPRADDGVLTLGVFLPRTGPGASLGGPMITAINDAVRTINESGGVLGQDVVLHEPVDESLGTGLDELLLAGVDAIIGPASSTAALSQLFDAVMPTTGVVTCSPSATALALDDFPDNKFFFRTVPSDSLQMAAIGRRVESTGVDTVTVGYLDDPYGRGLAEAFVSEVEERNRLDIQPGPVGFGADQEDLSGVAAELLAGDPGVIVVLGDADDGTRLLAAIDEATRDTSPPPVVVNDAIRGGRQAIQALSPQFREGLSGVAALATSVREDGLPAGFFAPHAVDCVNLIALAAIQAGSDAPTEIQKQMAAVSVGGSACTTFADCSAKLGEGLRIDYNGFSGGVELSTTTGELVRGWFEQFGFDDEGVDHPLEGGDAFEVQ